jgi:hypothetical protein
MCIYISYGRIGYCLVVYTVLCLGIIYAVGPGVATIQTPRRPFPCDVRQQKVLDIAIDVVSGALSMHAAPPAIHIICGTRRSDSYVRAS